ncbi:hypothetical protein EON78_01440, partial [bacterium]
MSEKENQGFNISEAAVKHPVSTIMFILTLIILGAISYTKLGVAYYPDITYPTVSVRVNYAGTAPGGMETLVTKPIEDSLSGISGVNHIRSFSTNGVANITVEFKLGKDIKDAANEVREKVAMNRRKLPEDIDEPIISRLDPDASPIINYSIISPEPLVNLTEYVNDKILPRIQQVDGPTQMFCEHFACHDCGISYPELAPRLFSFNSPFGACPDCDGLGHSMEVDTEKVVPNKALSLRDGAIAPSSAPS